MATVFNKTIIFDMDGTLVDLYHYPNWASLLEQENAQPYLEAKPLIDVKEFAKLIDVLHDYGYKFAICSWCSKYGSTDFNSVVRKAKKTWLSKNGILGCFDEIHITKYNTLKHATMKHFVKGGVLIDDDRRVRVNWWNKSGTAINPEQMDVITYLKAVARYETLKRKDEEEKVTMSA